MNQISLILATFFILIGCSQSEKQGNDFDINASKPPQSLVRDKASERIDLNNKGVGEITYVELGESIDMDEARIGKSIFLQKCTICHKVDEKFIGPPLKDILKRRSPEWVMNMILNPDIMIKEDSLAKDLFMEFNGSPMSNQNLTKEEARAVLEYFRTIDGD